MRRKAASRGWSFAAVALLAATWASASGCAIIGFGPSPTLTLVQQQANAVRWLLFGAAILVPAAAWLGWAWSRRQCGVRSWVVLLACESAALGGAVSAWKHFERQATTAAAATIWVAVSSGPYGTNFVALPTAPGHSASPPATGTLSLDAEPAPAALEHTAK
jgi:hypothetical protein